MPFLPGLAVVFAGIAGNQDHRVDQQVLARAVVGETVAEKQHVLRRSVGDPGKE